MRVSPTHISLLKQGGIAVMPTDTIYGVVGQALNQETVERLYKVRRRNPAKPFIILINSLTDLKRFSIKLTPAQSAFCRKVWPNKVSIVLPCKGSSMRYLHRNTNSLAFRMPKTAWLRALLKKTGPLVAPSANPEGFEPARTIRSAKAYFGDRVNTYIAGTSKSGKPSTLVSLLSGKPVVLRPGAVKI